MKAPLANNSKILSLARLRAVSAVAEEGSFSAAGRRLGISHTAVSQQIREMEAAHGIRLFERVGGALRPTLVCLELTEIGQRILAAETEASRILERRDSRGKPRLRLGLGNAMPGIAIAASLLARHGELSISIETGSHQDIMAAVLRRDIEVAVLPDVPPDLRFRRAPVLKQEVVAIVATDGPFVDRSSVTLEELAAAPLIFRSRGSSTQKVVDRAFRRAGLYPEPRLTADTRDAVYEAVTVGIGVGFMWRNGTYRTDTVQRIPVPELGTPTEEVAFALADERNEMVDLFFAAAMDFASEVTKQVT
jgi:molybdate transport repressor ModE-like protein